jgi:hypothetical protein
MARDGHPDLSADSIAFQMLQASLGFNRFRAISKLAAILPPAGGWLKAPVRWRSQGAAQRR